MAYAGMVQEYNDMISQQVNISEQAEESGVSDSLSKNLEEWKERADEYSHKFSALAEGGIGEIMSMAGLSKAYEQYQKYSKIYGDAQASVRKIDPRFDGVPKPEPDAPSLPDDVLERVRRLKNEPFEEVGDVRELRRTRAPALDESLLPQPEPVTAEPIPRGEGIEPRNVEPDQQYRNPTFNDEDLVRLPETEVNLLAPPENSVLPPPVDEGAPKFKQDEDLTDADLDSIVQRNLVDAAEGVGREAAPLQQTVAGITYGKTGGGADPQPRKAFIRREDPDADIDAVDRFNIAREPIDVQRLGVRGAAQEFTARAQPKPQITIEDIREQYKQLDRVNKNELKQKVDSGQLDANDLPSIQAEIQSRLQATGGPAPPPTRPPPALAEPDPVPSYQTEVRQVKQPAPTPDEDEIKPAVPDEPVKPIAEPDEPELSRPVAAPERELGTDAGDFLEERSGGIVSNIVKSTGIDEEIGALFGPVGEAVGAVAGIVSVADGLYHLFHHSAPSISSPTNLGNLSPQVNTNLTSKYASSIPTIDSAQQVSAAVSSF